VSFIRIPLASGAPLVEGTFVARPNQFTVIARLEGTTVQAHLADRGRLLDILVPDARLVLAHHARGTRKTDFQVVAADVGSELVSLDTHLPNRLVIEALRAEALPQFVGYTKIQPESQIGNQRFDFRLHDPEESRYCIVEVKSAAHVVNDLALFPDAPTERGRRQVEALTELVKRGQRAVLLFIVQRQSGRALIPNESIDPHFARVLRLALTLGVEVYAYQCPISREGIMLGHEIPVYSSMAALPTHG
jgi:sugar fermentation stimulation protein A